MKKLFSIFILFNFLIIQTFAAEVATISATPVQIQAEMLKEHCSGYEITLQNNGKNPAKIISIETKNAVGNASQILVSEGVQAVKKNNKYIYLSLCTLGIAGLIGNAKNSSVLNKQKEALAEVATFRTGASLENLKSEIIMPNKQKTIRLLFPLNEAPSVEVLLQDVQTNKYIETSLKYEGGQN